MIAWWTTLSALNQGFFVAAIFFSTIFGWQFISSLSGLGGEGDGDVSADADADVDVGGGSLDFDEGEGSLVEDSGGLAIFRLLSIRSILAFGTLSSWAGALYLQESALPYLAMIRALLWGLAGMAVVAFFFWLLPRLTEEGTASLDTAIGNTGQVYLDIPEDGVGQIKVLVSGSVSFVKARSRNGRRLPAGTVVRVLGRLDSTTLDVEEIES